MNTLHGSRRAAALTALVLLSGSLGACVSWHSGELRDVPWPPPAELRAEQPPKLALEIRFDTSASHTYESGGVTQLLDVAIPTIEESGLFEVATRREADYHLQVKVFDDAHPRLGLAILSGITLTLFPAVASDYYTIEAVLKDRAGRVIAERRTEETVTTMIQLFMLFGLPFAPPGRAGEAMLHMLWQDLVTWAWEAANVARGAPPPVSALDGRYSMVPGT